MKKFFRSKKALVLTSLLLIAVLVSGITFAWFTWNVNTEESQIELGRLILGAEFEVDDERDLYEPGLAVEKNGTVSNDGSLALIARLGLDGTVTIRSDLDGYPLKDANGDPAEYEVDISTVDGVTVAIDPACLGILEDADEEIFVVWFLHEATGDYYVLIDGNVEVDANFIVDLSGPQLGNLYQGAVIDYAKDWMAGQALDDAFEDIFGFPFDELEMYANNIGELGRMSRSASSGSSIDVEAVQARIDALMGR